MYYRTAQTLRNRTRVIESFFLPCLKKSIEVRELDARKTRKHFIVVFSDSLELNDWEHIAVVTEVNLVRNQVKFVTSPSSQYPELKRFDEDIQKRVNNIIECSVFSAA